MPRTRQRARRCEQLDEVLDDDLMHLIFEYCPPESLRACSLVCRAWRRQVKQIGLTVFLHSTDQDLRGKRFLGVYDCWGADLWVNGRPAYKMRENPERMLYYNGAGVWHAGMAAYVGQPKGCLQAKDDALTADLIKAQWEEWDRSAWQPMPTMGVRLPTAQELQMATAAAAKRQAAELAAATSVALVGSLELRPELCGVFDRRVDEPLVNNRPSYAMKANPERMMWYNGAGVWHAGMATHLGEKRGFLQASDDAPTAELITATWEEWDGSAWQPMPTMGVRAPTAQELQAASKAAERRQAASSTASASVALVGSLQYREEFKGVYDRADGKPLVNNRPSYVMRGDSKRVLYYNGAGVWHLGNEEHLGQQRGCLQSRDDAPTAELITATWEEWDGSSWIPAPSALIRRRRR